MYCKKCGTELGNSTKFCPKCGTSTDSKSSILNVDDKLLKSLYISFFFNIALTLSPFFNLFKLVLTKSEKLSFSIYSLISIFNDAGSISSYLIDDTTKTTLVLIAVVYFGLFALSIVNLVKGGMLLSNFNESKYNIFGKHNISSSGSMFIANVIPFILILTINSKANDTLVEVSFLFYLIEILAIANIIYLRKVKNDTISQQAEMKNETVKSDWDCPMCGFHNTANDYKCQKCHCGKI